LADVARSMSAPAIEQRDRERDEEGSHGWMLR
jgi:hypothetical protein